MSTEEIETVGGVSDPDPESAAAEPRDVPLPIGIARIRDEWREAGLVDEEQRAEIEVEPVVFPEVEGGAGVGDYTLDLETVLERLPLSEDAVERLISGGELDSILVQGPDGAPRRLVSESSFARFQEDSAIDPAAVARAAKAMADKSVAAAIDDLRLAIEEMRANQGKILQQMKDILLLEVRNLKEQDRDLTSFVYELAEEIRRVLPKKRR